jgi:selenocysteine lyase/cysteine desulfurase
MSFKSYFDLPSDCTYLHTPGSGLLSKALVSWRRERDSIYYSPSSLLREQQPDFLASVKSDVARFFGSKVKQTFLLPNFSFGFNTLLEGLRHHTKVLLLEEEYPSVNFPIVSRGFECIRVPIQAHLEEQIVEAIRLHRPSIFAFSMVQYISGVRLSLAFLRELRSLFPELLLLADGTQYISTEVFDFEKSGLDGFGASGYKWMTAGFGNGFLCLSDRLAEQLYPNAAQYGPPQEAFLQSKSILNMYFEPGHQDTLGLGSLQQAILLFEKLGQKEVANYVHSLGIQAKERFLEEGLLPTSIADRKEAHSNLFNVQLPQHLHASLIENGVFTGLRGTGIRIGLHLYNDMEDVNHFIQIAKKLQS